MDYKAFVLEMLHNLESQDQENLELQGRGGDTYHLVHRRQHTFKFRIHWDAQGEYFRVYFRDVDEGESQAIASLRTPYDAALFCVAADALFAIRARRRNTDDD